MNADSTKPSVAPKPRAVCHATAEPPPPHMSASRGPKPSVAPKPRPTPRPDGPRRGGPDGGRLASGGEAGPDLDPCGQKMEEDWRLSGGGLSEEPDSLEALWASDDALTADSVEMADTDPGEEMDAEGCDAGEALADADGVSVGGVDEARARLAKETRTGAEESELSEPLVEEPGEGRFPLTGRGRGLRNVRLYDLSPLGLQKVLANGEGGGRRREGSSDNYVEIFKSSLDGGAGPRRLYGAAHPRAPEVVLDCLASPPRVRLPSVAGASLASSRSETMLLSPDDSDLSDLPFLDDTTDTELDISEDRSYEDGGRAPEGGGGAFHFAKLQFGHRYVSGLEHPAMSSSPMLGSKQKNYGRPPLYLSRYPRSISMEAPEASVGVYSYMEGSPKQGGGVCFPGSFSRRSPSTSVVDIPPPFELAYITKRPVTKSSPSLFVDEDASEKNRKKKSSIKHFLMLKFRRKTDSKSSLDAGPSSFKSSSESVQHSSGRLLGPDGGSLRPTSPRAKPRLSRPPPSALLLERGGGGGAAAFLNRSIIRVESFEDRSRAPFVPLPLTKPRSISFPSTDTSDYEKVPPTSSDYENVPQRRPVRQVPFPEFFGRPARVLSSANETDGYVDMSSLPGFKGAPQSAEPETESAYTEAYKVCLLAAAPQAAPAADAGGATPGEDDAGRTSEEEEEEGADSNYERQAGRSRAFYIAKELVDTERAHTKALKLLQEDFREAVGAAVGDEGEPVLHEDRLREILNELPDIYTLHRRILGELENRIRHWDEQQRIADVFLSRKAEFLVFTTYIGHYDRSVSLLEDSCRSSAAFAAIVHRFEGPAVGNAPLQHQLLRVIVRVAQYRMILTDYLNNLSPDSKEYEDTQAAVAAVSNIADQTNDSLKDGENLLRLVNIEYSVRGQRELLQPGRVFVKEGTLMNVSRRSQQPRHLFLMNDVLLYTYPQQDGKYRLKNTLSLPGLKVTKPIIDNVPNALRIEGADVSLTLSASSFVEREDWFYTIGRTVSEHARGSAAFSSSSGEARDQLRPFLGEKPPTLVPGSHAAMCMNCTSDFSLTLRRHHCHGCGRIVCRSCSKNRYPLKYMKDRAAKVCDLCYGELKKSDGPAPSSQSSPRPPRSARPLSAVFQNIHPPNIWRHRKGIVTFTQVTVSEEGSISGTLQRSKKSKRSWKRLWFLLKDKVLYTYRAQEEKVASETLPLLGFTVKLPDGQRSEEEEEAAVFQLFHKNTLYYTFKAADTHTAQRWVNAMEEATVL